MRRTALFLSSLIASVALTGCSAMNTSAAPSLTDMSINVTGQVHGGLVPLIGTTVNVYSTNTSGYGGLSTFVNTHATTGANGVFSLTGAYTCNQGDLVYLVAEGGSTDGNPAHANTAIVLLSILGVCPSTGTSPFAAIYPHITINEATTVAAAYVLAPYALDFFNIGAPSSNANAALHPQASIGITNAFNNFYNLVDPVTGNACVHTALIPGGSCITNPNLKAAAPQTMVNTLANILAACINSSSPSSPACTTLFQNATTDGVATSTIGSTNPNNIGNAIIYLAQHPTNNNIAALCGLQTGIALNFVPADPCDNVSPDSYPHDLTLGIVYTAGSTASGAAQISIDGNGNAWVPGTGTTGVSQISAHGIVSDYTAIATGASHPYGSAIDTNGNLFVVNQEPVGLAIVDPTGLGTSFIDLSTQMSEPLFIALENGNKPVITDFGNDVVGFVLPSHPADSVFVTAPAAGLGSPTGVAVASTAGQSFIYIGNGGTIASVLASDTSDASSPNGGYPDSNRTDNQNAALGFAAMDSAGNAWFNDEHTSGFVSMSPAGLFSTEIGATGELTSAYPFAFDGGNHIWSTNGNGAVEIDAATGNILSPLYFDYQSHGAAGSFNANSSVSGPTSIAIDPSGDVWIAGGNVVELIGAATPVVTPIVANITAPYTSPASLP